MSAFVNIDLTIDVHALSWSWKSFGNTKISAAVAKLITSITVVKAKLQT
jgi:hypothetical protein